jgi:hypothetical protein
MDAKLTVTLWEGNAGNLILSLEADLGSVAAWTVAWWDMSGVDGCSTFAEDAEAILCGQSKGWTITPHTVLSADGDRPWGGRGWHCIAEFDGFEVTLLADRVGGWPEPGRAASIYLGVAAATR